MLKLFRRLHWGVNPELELGRFLTERSFAHAPPLAGALEYHRADGERLGLAAVHGWLVKAEGGWEYTLRALDRYYERMLSLATEGRKFSPACKPWIQLVRQEFPAEVPELVGTYLESARLLGRRTAELHLALAADKSEPGVRPGTLHDLLPAWPVPIHAQHRQAEPAQAAGRTGEPAARRRGRRRDVFWNGRPTC